MATLNVKIEVDDSGKIKLQGVDQNIKAADKSLASLASTAKMAMGAFAGFFTVVAAKKAWNITKAWLDEADAIGKTADAIGITTTALQTYGHAARLSGLTTQQFESAVLGFNKRLGELRAGTGELASRLKQMDEGLHNNIKSATNTEQALSLMFKALDKTANSADRAALAAAAFGREGGTRLVNMVRDGVAELERMRKEAESLGIVLDEELIRNSEAANDQLEIMTRIIKMQLMTAVLELAPEITAVAGGIADMATNVAGLIKELKEMSTFEGVFHLLMKGVPFGDILSPSSAGARPGEYEEFVKKMQAEGLPSTQPTGGAGTSRKPILLDPIKYFTDTEKALVIEWQKMAKSIGQSFNDALVDSLDNGLDSFKNFANDVKKIFLKLWLDKAITQPLIMPIINQTAGMFGFAGKGISPTTGGFSKMMGASAFGMEGGASYGQMLGAGAVGYGLGGIGGGVGAAGGMFGGELLGAAASTAVGGALGSTLGSVIPIVGTILGGVAGSAIGKLFSGSDKPQEPSIDLLYEVIDGELQLVSDHWKNTPKNQQLLDTIDQTFQAQIDFFDQIGRLTEWGGPAGSVAFSGRTTQDIQSMLPTQSWDWMIESFQDIKNLIPGYEKEFKDIFMSMWGNITPENIGNFWIAGRAFPKFTSATTTNIPTSPADILQQIISSENPLDIYRQWLTTGIQTTGTKAGRPAEAWTTPQTLAESNLGFMGDIAFSVGQTGDVSKYIEQASQLMAQISGTMASSIGGAFLDSLSTGEFADFEQHLRNRLGDSITSGIAQAFTMQTIDLLMSANTGMTGAFGLLNQFASGKSGVTFGDVQSAFDYALNNLGETIGTMSPIFQEMAEWLSNLTTEMGINTTAVTSNTDAIMGPVNSYLMSLSTGPLAPSQSLAGMAGMQDKLFTAALADPSQFSAYASYMTGSMLPFQQGISGDYAGLIAGEETRVGNIPWVSNARGGGGASAKEIGHEVGQTLGPMLQDIKESAPTTINIIVDGEIIKQKIMDSFFDDPDVVMAVRSVL